jgi:hypothetical protein
VARFIAARLQLRHDLPRNRDEALDRARRARSWIGDFPGSTRRKGGRTTTAPCAGAAMQMGPTLLPTPLSPACGCSDPGSVSGEPSTVLSSAHTWRPMSYPVRPTFRLVSFDLRLATGASGLRHRRSRRHPAFAPALLRSSSARRLRFPRPCAFAQPRPRSLTGPDHRALPGLRLSHALLLSQVTWPAR